MCSVLQTNPRGALILVPRKILQMILWGRIGISEKCWLISSYHCTHHQGDDVLFQLLKTHATGSQTLRQSLDEGVF